MARVIKNSFLNFFVIFVIFTLATGWMFSGWPRIWQNPQIPPEIKEAKAAISYVGGQVGSFGGKTTETTVDFSLTNGSDSAPAAGDLVIVAYSIGSTANRTTSMYIQNDSDVEYTTAGSKLYQNDSYDSNLQVAYRFMPSPTPETSIVLSGTGSSYDAGAYTIHVFRGIDPDTPLDVAAVEAGNINTRIADPGSILPTTSGVWIYVVGAAAAATGGTYTAAYLTDFRAISQADNRDAMIGAGYVTWSSGTYNPVAFTDGGTDTANDSWTAITLALRPAVPVPDAPTLYPDDGGSNQIAFNNTRQNDTTPVVRVSATHTSTLNRFQVEFNTASDFGGTAYTETFSGTYTSGTAYNLQTTGTLDLPSTDGVTYYVRAKASADGGTNYGDWSSGTWTYTYKSSGNPDWFQTTDEQFDTGTSSSTQTSGSGSVELGGDAQYIRANATAGSLTTTLDIGTASTNRLVAVFASSEADSAIALSSVTVDSKSCHLVQAAHNTNGLGNRTELWYCDEDDLGSSNGSVTIAISGTSLTAANWAVHGQLFTGISQSGPSDSGTDTTSIDPTKTTTVTGIDVPVGGIVVMGICNGTQNLSVDSWTSPLVGRTDVDPSSADSLTATGIETSAQTDKTYQATWSSAPNRSSGVAASWALVVASSGTIESPQIDFSWVLDMDDWDEVAVGATTTNGSINIDILDENSADTGLGCTISGGDPSCAIDISSLDPAEDDTQISILATLSDSGGTPFLNDWTVSWTAAAAVSISLTSDGIVDFGTVGLSSTKDTTGAAETVLIESGPADLNIKTSLFATSTYEWSLSADLTSGDDEVVWQYATTTEGPWNIFSAVDPTEYDLADNVAQDNSQDVYFKITMPTGSDSMEKYFSTVTIVASSP